MSKVIVSEEEIRQKIEDNDLVIYLDECAAGVLCGDLYVCGVVFKKDDLSPLVGQVNDSKKINEKRRALLYPLILEKAFDYELVKIYPEEVDSINILQARMEGFRRAIEILADRTGAKYAVIDGNRKPSDISVETDVLIKGDGILAGISCASIIAKHSHTVFMKELAKEEPYLKYGLDKHKGYGTAVHLEALKLYGPIKGFHRFTYEPVRKCIK